MNPKYISITGPSNVGKTTMLRKLYAHFINLGYKIVPDAISEQHDNHGYGEPPGENINWDFYVLLEGPNGELVLLYSWGDVMKNIEWLARYIEELERRGYKIRQIFFAVRDITDSLYSFTKKRLKLTKENNLEIPLGRMKACDQRKKAIDWYREAMFNLITEYIIPKELGIHGL